MSTSTDREQPDGSANRHPTGADGDAGDAGSDGAALDRALRAAFGRRQTTHYETDHSGSVEQSISEHSDSGALHPILPPLGPNDAPTRALAPDRKAAILQGGTDDHSRYDVLHEVARGGAGSVMRARDQRMGRDVAMKVLGSRHRKRSTMSMRFLDEVRIAGQLQHPGVVPVYDRGENPDGQPYFTMKLVRGETLSAMLKSRPAVTTDRHRFLRIFEQVCQTIAYAHSRGVVHRDLKPANIMVGRFGEVLVLDWGLARVLRTPASVIEEPVDSLRADDDTAEGGTYGTPAFMPPEQARGKAMDERADVFSLGAVLCQILTGKPPYAGATPLALLGQAAQGDLDPVHQTIAATGADTELVNLAVECLQTDVEKRPRHAGVLAERVSAYLARVDQRARDAEIEAARQRARATYERRVRRLAVVLALAALLIVGGVVWVAWQAAEQRQQTDHRVEELLTRASTFSGRREWAEAVDLARRAVDVAESGQGSEVVSDRARTLLRECEAAQRVEDLLHKVSLVHDQVALNPPDSSKLYTEAFRDFGVDVQGPADVAVKQIQAHDAATAAELVQALDDWASRVPPHGSPETEAEWQRIVTIASRADTDNWRNLLRQAVLAGETMVLQELARTVGDEQRPPQNFLLLAQGLDRLFMPIESEIDVLRAGYLQHPGDYWINIALAHRLAFPKGGARALRNIDWAERHARSAWALQPDSSEAMITLAAVLIHRSVYMRMPRRDDLTEAKSVLDQAQRRSSHTDRFCDDCILAAQLWLDDKRPEAAALAESLLGAKNRMAPQMRALLEVIRR